MKNKKIILISGAILVIGLIGAYGLFFKNKEGELRMEKVSRGTVVKEVSETGAVKVSEKINVGFKNSGRIESVGIRVGDIVESGQEVAKIDSKQLNIELAEAQASLDVAIADYDRLLAGYSVQEIQVAKTQLLNAEVSLRNAEQNLRDVELEAEDDLNDSHEDAIDDLEDAKLKVYNALNVVNDVRLTYFSYNDQEGFAVNSSKEEIESAYGEINSLVSNLNHSDFTAINNSLSAVKRILSDVGSDLEVVRNMSETAKYKDTVSSASKTSLDNQKSYIATAKSNIANAQQAISTTKVGNDKAINSAKSSVALAKSNVDIVRDQLLLKEAGPTGENTSLYLAKVNQAKANLLLLQDRVGEAVLRSPTKGQITEINKKAGETIQPSDYVVSILPSGPFEVEVDIYEEDIVDVKEGNSVRINIPAFPDREFKGKVASVDPAEKMVDGVVYYEVIINFEETDQGMKPGMTADVVIETQKKENVVIVPREALRRKEGNYLVKVSESGGLKEKRVEIGIIGEDNAEVISGLSEGEEVVIE